MAVFHTRQDTLQVKTLHMVGGSTGYIVVVDCNWDWVQVEPLLHRIDYTLGIIQTPIVLRCVENYVEIFE